MSVGKKEEKASKQTSSKEIRRDLLRRKRSTYVTKIIQRTMEDVEKGALLRRTPYRRQILSCVLAFSPRLCDVLGRVEGEASVPRVLRGCVRGF